MIARTHGFTLIDLLVTVSIIAVVAAIVVPSMGDDKSLRLMAAAKVMTSDIELAQVMTIAFPDDPIVVRFDPGNDQYWLARPADPDTPIIRADSSKPYLVVIGQHRASSAAGVTYAVVDADANTLAFNALGGVVDMTAAPSVTLSLGDRWIRLDVASTTGTITEAAGHLDADGIPVQDSVAMLGGEPNV
jgi:prepilin-type N-terminal cleavage/methylation domain-containing protein